MFYGTFKESCSTKTKFLRANHSKFETKDLSKAIMLRTKLRNLVLKKRNLEARKTLIIIISSGLQQNLYFITK